MRVLPSIFTSILKPIERRAFKVLVSKHRSDAYGKSFNSWEHLVALLFAQVTGALSLRAIEVGFNAQVNLHGRLCCSRIARTTLADANARRPAALLAELFGQLVGGLGRKLRHEAQTVTRLIDSTPIPLNHLFTCAASNGHIKGFKLHVLHDLGQSCPVAALITPANVNDIGFGRALKLESNVVYVFDKAYCHFGWWLDIHQAGSVFVTRPKTSVRWKTLVIRSVSKLSGEGFKVLADCEVKLASKGDSTLPMELRRITIERDNGKIFDIVTNDMQRSALAIAALYKARWQVELFFKWLKQNLNIKKFIAYNDNAVRLQIFAALITFVLLQIARQNSAAHIPPKRFRELVRAFIHTKRKIQTIEKPPPGRAVQKIKPNMQLQLC
jgi:putative transposase